MNDKLIHSQKRLHDSLFELYMQGGLELYLAGTRRMKRARDKSDNKNQAGE